MKKKNISLKAILILIGVGIWAIVLQNAGIIPTKQNVYVKGGYIDANVRGSVDIDNTVDVSGSVDIDNTVNVSGSVEIENTVDVNIDAINGYSRFYDNSSNKGMYFRLPVYTGDN